MTITTLIIINIAFILGITLAFILGRKSGQYKKKAKKLKRKAKKTKKVKAKVTHGDAESPSKKAVSDQKKGRNTKKTMKIDPSAFDSETLKVYRDAKKAVDSVLLSYDQANVGAQPELNLDPDEYLKNMPKMMKAK